MSMTGYLSVEQRTEQRDALVDRLFQATLGLIDLCSVSFGNRLGLYQALADIGWATTAELAIRTGTAERYVREWLEQQAVTGILEVEDESREATARRYRLPPGHAEVFLDRESLSYQASLAQTLLGIVHALPALLHAFRTGGGVPYQDYGGEVREGQAEMNRPHYLTLLGTQWLPAIADIHARLQADPPAQVADIGCGTGWSSIALARTYPKVKIDGFDVDEASIILARVNAAEAGLAERVTFHVRDAADATLSGRYDLVTAFETIHDIPRPVEALRVMRTLVGVDGAVIVMDERVGETFAAPGDDRERFFYGASILFCLPTGMADASSAGTGTIMRPSILRRYALEAGFRAVDILPIEHDFWRFYRLTV